MWRARIDDIEVVATLNFEKPGVGGLANEALGDFERHDVVIAAVDEDLRRCDGQQRQRRGGNHRRPAEELVHGAIAQVQLKSALQVGHAAETHDRA